MNNRLHDAYLVGIGLKGLDGLVEVASGIVLFLISGRLIVHVTTLLVQRVLADDPGGFLATHALHAATHLSAGTQQFASAYLLIHGLIKVGLVAGLLRGWRSAYPVALLLLSAFIGYQVFRVFRRHSLLLAAFTVVDIAIVLLIWLEWRRVRRLPDDLG